jgi:hypothetical protein
MKFLFITLITIALSITAFPNHSFSSTLSNNSIESENLSDSYTVRANISGKWYLITYNLDGYIIDIIEDDE